MAGNLFPLCAAAFSSRTTLSPSVLLQSLSLSPLSLPIFSRHFYAKVNLILHRGGWACVEASPDRSLTLNNRYLADQQKEWGNSIQKFRKPTFLFLKRPICDLFPSSKPSKPRPPLISHPRFPSLAHCDILSIDRESCAAYVNLLAKLCWGRMEWSLFYTHVVVHTHAYCSTYIALFEEGEIDGEKEMKTSQQRPQRQQRELKHVRP